MMSKVLIINTKGGGHAFIGLHLSRALLAQGHSVDLLQVGAPADKAPFGKYAQLAGEFSSFAVRYGDVTADSVGTGYDAVYDNNAKSPEDVDAVIAAGKAGADVFYVSSAGAYTYDQNLAPHLSGDAAKGATITVEDALRGAGVSTACFRPIYIVGEASAKREYLDYFFDRIQRDRPVLIPGTGSEFTSLTDVRDVASMLAAALGNKSLKNDIINLVSSRGVTFDGVAKMCAAACGKTATIIRYDPDEVAEKVESFSLKKAFPFRVRHFFADPFEAQDKLGWTAEHSDSKDALLSAIKDSYEEYVQLGLDKASISFTLDDSILQAVRCEMVV